MLFLPMLQSSPHFFLLVWFCFVPLIFRRCHWPFKNDIYCPIYCEDIWIWLMEHLVDRVWLYCCYQGVISKYSDLCRTWWILTYKGHMQSLRSGHTLDIPVDGDEGLKTVRCYAESSGVLKLSVAGQKSLSEEVWLTGLCSMEELGM